LSANTPPSPSETEFWLDLTSEEGSVLYANVSDLPPALDSLGALAYVSSNQSLYIGTTQGWKKFYPNYDSEALSWMGF
jgi:hypothetical protein